MSRRLYARASPPALVIAAAMLSTAPSLADAQTRDQFPLIAYLEGVILRETTFEGASCHQRMRGNGGAQVVCFVDDPRLGLFMITAPRSRGAMLPDACSRAVAPGARPLDPRACRFSARMVVESVDILPGAGSISRATIVARGSALVLRAAQ